MIVQDFTKKDVVEWVLIQRPEFGVEAQWQARVRERSVAVVAERACAYPRCDCVGYGEHGSRVVCDAHCRWRGVLIGPDNVVVDLDIERRLDPITADEAKSTAEQGLRDLGWRV